MMDAERSEWEQSAPHDAFEWRHLYSIIYVAFQGCLIDRIQKLNRWTLSQSGGMSDFNIKCTRWVTVGERRAISVTLIVGAFIFIRKGKGKKWHLVSWDWHSTTPHISLQVLLGTDLYVVLPRQHCLRTEDESESEGKWKVMWHSRATCRSSELEGLGLLSVMFSCEERAVERERKGYVTSAVRWTLWSYKCLDIVIVMKIKIAQCFYS